MRKSRKFYDALPKHKAELVDGKMIVGGSLEKSAMTLGYMVENLGAKYVSDLCPPNLLADAVIDVYGNPAKESSTLADFTPLELSYYPPQKLATDLRMGLFKKEGIFVSGGTVGIKLGEDVFMPDIYVLKNEKVASLKDYYLEGIPDLIIEVVHPYMRSFDFGIRLEKYAAAGLPEVWMLDYEKRSFEPMTLKNGVYEKQPVIGKWYASTNIKGIKVEHKKLYDSAEEFGIRLVDIFEVAIPDATTERPKFDNLGGYEYGSVPFNPRLDLAPVPITFPEFISWGGEVKFEMIDGKPLFGGGEETTKEWLGLLMMTLGLRETVRYLSKEKWSRVL